jgi:hypothetical protein
MTTVDTTTEAFAKTRPSVADRLPDYAPIPRPALGPELNEQGCYVGRVERIRAQPSTVAGEHHRRRGPAHRPRQVATAEHRHQAHEITIKDRSLP